MGLRDTFEHVGSLFTRLSSVRPSSLWWRSAAVVAVVHRLEWLRHRANNQWRHRGLGCAWTRSENSLNMIMSMWRRQGRTFTLPLGGRGGSGMSLEKQEFLYARRIAETQKTLPSAWSWLSSISDTPRTARLFSCHPSPGGKLMFCSVSSPGRTEVDLAAAGSKACGGFDSQLRVRSVAPALVVAVHGAELGLQGWWRRWASLSSALPEWAKLLSSVSSSITISRKCTRRPGQDMCTDPPSYWTGTCMNWRFWTSRQSPPSRPAPVRYHVCAGTSQLH